MDKKLLNIIKIAVYLEKRDIEYYRKAAEKTRNPNGKKVFNYLADEGENQLVSLKKHLASAEGKDTWLSDEKTISRSKCRIKRKKPEGILPKKVKTDADDLEALRQAVEIEKKSIRFYEDLACETKDKKALKVLNYMIESENEHLKELEIQYAFLKSEGFWYDNEVSPS
ncbi:MAG: ferritin family protein [Candidatus Altiarchaeota archaeon]